jgi:hypothetical protein
MLPYWSDRKTILSGMLAAGSVAAFFLAPVPGAIAAAPPIDARLPGATETATFALG